MIYSVRGTREQRLLVDAPDLSSAVQGVIDLHQGEFILTSAQLAHEDPADEISVPLQTIAAEPLPQAK